MNIDEMTRQQVADEITLLKTQLARLKAQRRADLITLMAPALARSDQDFAKVPFHAERLVQAACNILDELNRRLATENATTRS